MFKKSIDVFLCSPKVVLSNFCVVIILAEPGSILYICLVSGWFDKTFFLAEPAGGDILFIFSV